MPAYQKIIWVGLGLTVVAIFALGYFLFLAPASSPKTPELPETTAVIKPQEVVTAEAEEEPDPAIVPLDLDLDHSDDAVRELVAAVEIPAAMREWIRRDNLIRSFVAVVDNIAQGISPASQLPFMTPAGPFSVMEKNGKLILDSRSFRRYDPMVNVFVAIADKSWIIWHKKLRPTLEKAFKELGYPGITFSQRLQQAIEQLLQAPLIHENIELERKLLSFAFVDPSLENLNPAQKQLLRMGPGNMARLQKKLRGLTAALNQSRKNTSR